MPNNDNFELFKDSKIKFHSPLKKPNKFVRFVGVELEVAGANTKSPDPMRPKLVWDGNVPCDCGLKNCGTKGAYVKKEAPFHYGNPDFKPLQKIVVNKWHGSIGYDGSLPIGKGFEIKTAPAIGSDFCKQIREIARELVKIEALVNEKCGTHIHVDARDFDWQDLRKLMFLYAKYEAQWIKTQPPARVLGKYCRPLGPDLIKDLSGLDWTKDKTTFQVTVAGKYEYSDKYKALNFQAYKFHKTVEIRLHEGTIDPEALIHWARCWSIFVQSAKDMTIEQILLLKPGLEPLKKLLNTTSADYIEERQQKYADNWQKIINKGTLKWAS